MKTYKTLEIAQLIGIHPNTVRMYEELELIPKPERQPNGYRVFTDIHVEQFRLARLAFQIEVLQNGLRRKIVRMVKTSAAGDYDTALKLTQEYLMQVREEIANAEEAIVIVKQILDGRTEENIHAMKRKEVSEYLKISMDTLRNWEMNGLLTVRRKRNGYRVYTDEDIKRLKIIRSLRCANYSLEAILTMLVQLSQDPEIDIKKALDTPREDTEIIAVCDKLVTSLMAAMCNAEKMILKLKDMKSRFS
ncbi:MULTISPECIES: MerR family transcriptional regulator [Blautia]|uniref:MerR family transcriptional regulator n=1 Tax=Blautia TaxID=572511 RepID=UPI000BA40626|nr:MULTISPECIES: MerR family transcriptional regulator [Blautia]